MKTSRQRQPTFFWQGVLIVLPVVMLAGAAVWSLRQDRILARHEAIERAEALAQETASALWSKLTAKESLDQFKDHTFRVNSDGRLVFPPPAPALPLPQVLNPSTLNSAQRESWAAFQGMEFDVTRRTQAIAAARRFLDLTPPETFAAVAQFRLGQLLAAERQFDEAVSAFSKVRERFAEARSESGVPLGPLAELKSLELLARSRATNTAAAGALNALCSNLVSQPSFFTAHLLSQAEVLQTQFGLRSVVEPWRREWERQEPLRALADAALKEWAKAGSREDETRVGGPGFVSGVPALSWFEALDTSPQPQPVSPHGRSIYPGKGRVGSFSQNTIGSLTISGRVASAVLSTPPEQESGLSGVGMPQHTPREWLATRIDDGQGHHAIVCRVMGYAAANSKASIGSPAWLDLRDSIPTIPAWFGLTIDLAGVPLRTTNDLQTLAFSTGGKGSGQTWVSKEPVTTPEIMTTARRAEHGIEWLRVNVHLVGPEMLFARQRTRSYLFGLLIAASALAAITGFVSAHRAFVRQQQLSDMKSNFVSSVSHELRAPIASVRLLAESLERGKVAEPAKQNEYFRFIVQECRRLSSLIENVLDFARIEQGRKQYEFEPTDVLALVGKTVKLLEPVAAEKQVTLQLQLPERGDEPFPEPALDASAIQQALVNLLDNAVKHAPAGSEVTVGLDLHSLNGVSRPVTPESSSGAIASPSPGGEGRGEGGPISVSSANCSPSELHLWVQDRGRGIPREEHQRIFQRFYRPGSEMRRETQGVGIGLSIVKHIVQAHGGHVRVESEVGKGSRFTIELPLRRNDQSPMTQ